MRALDTVVYLAIARLPTQSPFFFIFLSSESESIYLFFLCTLPERVFRLGVHAPAHADARVVTYEDVSGAYVSATCLGQTCAYVTLPHACCPGNV
jgi:hypothetical protein